uniref:Uncharacterized protein n=1 Tax=Rhodopseudomonas palustris (strain DX-1) TaxID=652103 RepID=E6VQ25_RHOPX
MLFDWLKRRRAAWELAEADADALMEGYGDAVFDEVRRRVREEDDIKVLDGNRGRGHWQRVGTIIWKRTGRNGLDTATKYLEG